MFETWSGMPLPVQFLLSFLIILGVIGAIWWTVRRFGSGRLGASTRGRQPRLAVIDYASVDNRRRLILVRRDNIEHLLMIGGPTDIVVEPNIVRAVPAARDVGRAPAGIEAITRAIPLPDSGGGSWPLQPEANGGSRPGIRPDAPHDDVPGRSHPEPRQRDNLAALADELSMRMTPPSRNRGNVGEPPRPEPRQEQRQEHRQEQRQEHRQEQRTEPRLEPRKPVQAAGPASPPPSVPSATGEAAGGDQSLADMAQRLEAALRKPAGEARSPGSPARPAAAPETPRSDSSPPAPAARNPRASEPRPAPADAGKPNQNKTAIYDTLEQEMANLLGRPSKT